MQPRQFSRLKNTLHFFISELIHFMCFSKTESQQAKGNKKECALLPPPLGNKLRSEHADESCLAFVAAENQQERVDGFRRAWSEAEIRWKAGNA